VAGKILPLPEPEQLEGGRIGSPNAAGDRWFRIVKKSNQWFYLQISRNSGMVLKTIPIATTEHFASHIFLDQDSQGYVYLESKRTTGDSKNVPLEVRKYSEQGRLVASVPIPGKYYTVVYKKITVDRNGNIYQLLTLPEGVRIIKWQQVR
jgi:hypothetical protein